MSTGDVSAAVKSLDIDGLKAKAHAWRKERDVVCEALNLKSTPEARHEGADAERAPIEAGHTTALAHFASVLRRPAAELAAKWQEQVLTSLPPESSIEAEVDTLARLCQDRAKAEQLVRECRGRKDEASKLLETALRREEKSSHGLRKLRHGHHAKNLEKANSEQTKCAQEYQEAVEDLEERSQLCIDMTQQVLKDISDEQSTHSRGLRDVVRHAVLALEEWAQDTRGAVMELKGQGGFSEEFAGEGAYDDDHLPPLRQWLASRSNTGHFPPDTPTQSTAAGRSGSSTPSTASASDREESVLPSETLEQQLTLAAEENEALEESLQLQRCSDGKPPPLGPSTVITEEALCRLATQNRELERSLRERRPRMKRTCADLEQDVFALESLTHACLAAVDQTGRVTATGSTARPAPAMPVSPVVAPAPSPFEVDDHMQSHGDAGALIQNPFEADEPGQNPFGAGEPGQNPFEAGEAEVDDTMQNPFEAEAVNPFDAEEADNNPFDADVAGQNASSEPHRNPRASMPELQASGSADSTPRSSLALSDRGSKALAEVASEHAPSRLNPFSQDCTEQPQAAGDTCGQDAADEDGSALINRRRSQTWVAGKAPSDIDSEEESLRNAASSWTPGDALDPRLEDIDRRNPPRSPRSSMPVNLDDVSPPGGRRLLNRSDLASTLSQDTEERTPRGSMPERPSSLAPVILGRASYPGRMSEAFSGLKGCLPPQVPPPALQVQEHAVVPGEEVAQKVEQAFATDPLEVALRRSDRELYRHHLGRANGYWNWTWEDYAVEERHTILQRSTHKIMETFSDEDWNLFSYELLLLLHESLLTNDPEGVLEHIRATLAIFRVRLGIPSLMHAHVSALSVPDDIGHSYHPLDVRYRAVLLLRAWARAESPCMASVEDHLPEWKIAWIRRQLAVLRGSVIMRALSLRYEKPEDALAACGSCLQILELLEEKLESGLWGKPHELNEISKPSGRRLLAILMYELDALRPRDPDPQSSPGLGMWRLDTIFAANAFSRLWVAATDLYSETSLSLDAPQVAAALLSGLHPRVGAMPLQLETHALLLAQQIWLALSSTGPSQAQGFQLPAEAMNTAAKLLGDFSEWLQTTPVSPAIGYPHRDAADDLQAEAVEVTMRRLLSLELRDGLANTLSDYRRHLDPEAFKAAVLLWRRSHLTTTCSEELISAADAQIAHADRDLSSHAEGDVDVAALNGLEGTEQATVFLRRMGQFFIWKSVRATAELALAQFDDPEPVREEGWRKSGPRVMKHLEGLTGAVKALCDELECEHKFYNSAWELGDDHLGIAAAAFVASVRPRVVLVVERGLWPNSDAGVCEVPPGGGKLLHALESLDRLANRWKEPQDLSKPQEGSLVDILSVHVSRALEASFKGPREIIQGALGDNDEDTFKPMSPTMLHCETVVTIWRFINSGLDAPISLGVPTALVVQAFLKFLQGVLTNLCQRLHRPEEKMEKFRLAVRAEHIVTEIANTHHEMDSDEDDVSGPETAQAEGTRGRQKGRRSRRGWLKGISSRSSADLEAASKNVLTCASDMSVDSAVIARPCKEVIVRLCSLGFCLVELRRIHSRIKQYVDSGDDADCPTQRVNEARMMTMQELPELEDELEQIGKVIVKYLTARVLFSEMQKEFFEKLYFEPTSKGSSTPRGSTSGDTTPPVVGCLTLQGLLQQRGDSLMSLVKNCPAPLAAACARQLGTRLVHAWMLVIVDYLRKQKRDALCEHLEEDQDELRKFLIRLVQEARKRSGESSAGGLSDECDQCVKELDKVQDSVGQLVVRAASGEYSIDSLARYAEKIFMDAEARFTGVFNSASFGGGSAGADCRGRSSSPAPNHVQPVQPARSPSLRGQTPPRSGSNLTQSTLPSEDSTRRRPRFDSDVTGAGRRERVDSDATAATHAGPHDDHHRRRGGAKRILGAPVRGLRRAFTNRQAKE